MTCLWCEVEFIDYFPKISWNCALRILSGFFFCCVDGVRRFQLTNYSEIDKLDVENSYVFRDDAGNIEIQQRIPKVMIKPKRNLHL